MRRRLAALARCPGLLLAMAAMAACMPTPTLAQGRIESFFNSAANFLERQGRAIERELNQGSGAPTSQASRRKKAAPPLPQPNPRRSTKVAEAKPKETKESEKAASPDAPSPEPRPETASRATPAPEPARPERQSQPEPAPAQHNVASTGTDHDAVPLPDRNPAPDKAGKEPEKPKKPHPSEMASAAWTKAEIDGGRGACAKMLARIVATYEPVDPIREGICGAPAPIRLSAVNATHRVEINPPALVTCAMAVQLANWLRDSVQPAAKKHLGEQIVAVRNAASYSCRNRYNAPGKPISEHALVNALDIAAFETTSGKTVTLLQHWHAKQPEQVTERQARKADNQAEAEAAEAVRQDDKKPEISPASARRLISATEVAARENPPPPDPKPQPPEMIPAPEADFLHAAFDGACNAFGTVLGPEANAAHRDHFHLDMKARTYGGFCE